MTPIDKNTRRVTRGALDGSHGCDRGRKLVVELVPGDMVKMRPHGTRRAVSISIFDAYRYAVKCRVSWIERRTKELVKSGMRRAQARRQAEKETA